MMMMMVANYELKERVNGLFIYLFIYLLTCCFTTVLSLCHVASDMLVSEFVESMWPKAVVIKFEILW